MEYTTPKGEPITISLEKPSETFRRVISALRLFKPGLVGLSKIYQRPVYRQPGVGGTLSSPIHEAPVPFLNPTYELTQAEAGEFLEFYNWLLRIETSSELALELAIRRFNLAYGRAILADRLIDMMIAFEALFLPERDELALRLSLRVANLLRDTGDRQDIFTRMKRAYKLRSNIVHGSKIKDEELSDCVQTIEELLRQSLRSLLKLVGQGQRLPNIISKLDDATFT